MKTSEIRSKFLDYFAEKGHTIVPSSALVPHGDTTLLFTNAGMVQFKDVFLGLDPRPYTRAATAQKCVRAGGKHNDLDNVGYTARHHTFFEMMGNFSFGDYFKREAIQMAWGFLTEVLKLPKEKLWVTVFEEDDEAADIWLNEMKIDPTRFSRCGEKDNFWSMGDTGPCGPCSEIFYDHGPEVAGGPPGSPDADGDRYIEIWNLVFMQFNRDSSGKITPLPKPSVDTGMGLERVSAVLQQVHNNYEIDLFQKIIAAIEALLPQKTLEIASLRVIADHIRSTSFLICDGIVPSNEGRGYVLRRIIRRAIRHGHKIGFEQPFFHKIVASLVEEMDEAYPELKKNQTHIENVLLREEQQFANTLDQGMKLFQQTLDHLTGNIIPGQVVFWLYDTYGFPIDLTADIAREKGLMIDEEGFHREMEVQRQRSQAASRFSVDYNENVNIEEHTCFIGYEHLNAKSKIAKILVQGQLQLSLSSGQEAAIVLLETPFYAESGGQVGDKGQIVSEQGIFQVHDTQKKQNAILHFGRMIKGQFAIDQIVSAEVELKNRQDAAANHSATHLLNAALREILGDHVLQKGSLVEPERLRFDFSHFEALSQKHLYEIEDLVNQAVRANYQVETQLMTPEEAMDKGAVALFGEKYGTEVRVLSMGDFSMELCGGTHVQRTGDIGLFKIVSESGVAAGVRRIEAVTSHYAIDYVRRLEQELQKTASLVKADVGHVAEKIELNLQAQKALEKKLESLQSKMASLKSTELLEDAKLLGSVSLLVKQVEVSSVPQLRELLDQLKSKLANSVIVLTTIIESKASLICGVSKELTSTVHAGQLVQYVAEQLGGKGGGRPDMAQGGGENVQALPKALSSVEAWVSGQLTKK